MRIKSDKNGEPKNSEPSVVAHECLCNCLVAEKLLMELLSSARCSFEIIWKNSHAAEIPQRTLNRYVRSTRRSFAAAKQ